MIIYTTIQIFEIREKKKSIVIEHNQLKISNVIKYKILCVHKINIILSIDDVGVKYNTYLFITSDLYN